ncbi:MAG: endonuclease/exonuclease/phosphatase family protein [Paludibacteraceae bacterium]
MKHLIYTIGSFMMGVILISCGATKPAVSDNKVALQVLGVGFYNLENLFDTINQANLDEEFLPDGSMHWTSLKYKAKLKNMAYAISQIGQDVTPRGVSILGVSEIENRGVLEDLVKEPTIANRTLRIVHYDSPDRRGVDVGLLYNPRDFVVSASKSYRLNFPEDTTLLTRDQLLVSGYLLNEKIHVIVGHWPSRIGGEQASAPKRNAAAALSKHIADSLYRQDANAKIIIMGDFNDDPFNESAAKILDAKKNRDDVPEKGLYNPMWRILDSGVGSLAYNNQWNLFDQIIISKPFLHNDNTKLRFWKAEIFNKNFLIQQEGSYKGSPLRTHAGGVWLNGYSDHFPTLIYLVKEK